MTQYMTNFVLWIKDEATGYRAIAKGVMESRKTGEAIYWRDRTFICNQNSVGPNEAHNYYEVGVLICTDDDLELVT